MVPSFSADPANELTAEKYFDKLDGLFTIIGAEESKFKVYTVKFTTTGVANQFVELLCERKKDITYEELRTGLCERFQVREDPCALELALALRVLRPNESVRVYGTAIEILCHKVLPTMSEEKKIEHFLKGLPAQIWRQTAAAPKTTLVQAMEIAERFLDFEKELAQSAAARVLLAGPSCGLAGPSAAALPVAAQPSNTPSSPTESAPATSGTFDQQMSKISEMMDKLITLTTQPQVPDTTAAVNALAKEDDDYDYDEEEGDYGEEEDEYDYEEDEYDYDEEGDDFDECDDEGEDE